MLQDAVLFSVLPPWENMAVTVRLHRGRLSNASSPVELNIMI